MVDFVLHMMGKGLDDDEEDEEDDEVNKWRTATKYVLGPDKKGRRKDSIEGGGEGGQRYRGKR